MHDTQNISFLSLSQENYVLQKSGFRKKKIADSILTAAGIVLQATELSFSGKTVMPFYGFRRAGEGMPINTSNS